ncbi:Oligosaccaryltransferase protein [Raphanus sativus]|nr:Oligosaccaryltransferase protein [Raphanus sativus]
MRITCTNLVFLKIDATDIMLWRILQSAHKQYEKKKKKTRRKELWIFLKLWTFTSRLMEEVSASTLSKMFDDQDLGFFANFLGIFIFILVIAYHFVVADPKFE